MKEWFEKLDPRERKIVVGGGITFVVICIYFLMWSPFVRGLETLRKSTAAKQELLVWMRNSAQEVKRLRAQNPEQSSVDTGQSMLGVIDRTAKHSKLGPAMKRIKPEGSSKTHVWLEGAAFNNIVRWLEILDDRHDIKVVSSMVNKEDQPGLVNVRLVLARTN